MFFSGNGTIELLINLSVTCVEPAIPDHFKMLLWDMADQACYEVHSRDSLDDIFVIFMPVVVESDIFSIIFVDPGSGNDRTAKIAADVFDDGFGITFVRFGINIETMFMIRIAFGFNFLKRRPQY